MNYDLYKFSSPFSEIISRQQKIYESLNYASRISAISSVSSLIESSGLNRIQSMASQIIQMSNLSELTAFALKSPFDNISNMLAQDNLAFTSLTSSIEKLREYTYKSSIDELSLSISRISEISKFINNNVMLSYMQSMKNITDSILTPTMTFREVIDKFNWEDIINSEEFEIEEEEKERVLEETKKAVEETFSDISENNVLDFTSEQSKNLEQKWIEIWKRIKEMHPILADIVSKTYSKFFEKLFDTIITIFMIMLLSSISSGKLEINKSFEKVKNDITNTFTISDAKKEAKEVIKKEYYPVKKEIFNIYRYVDKNDVYIRESHRMDGFGVKKLDEGDIVEVQYNDTGDKKRYKNWMYVTYEDEEGNIYEGWINNIYINRIDSSR
ncbi:hypothetical protein [Clostridium beijerinckii]|uniref:SH3b domain-containing protein n=1 Tax=Clostridium beijerinckii TaxID=1520 RepID=A0AAW3W2F5_CLOBE|nr:hypothetical protein [Clostridium beijerinckii]MBC2455650.1 hypothetical protein [Clostridium beijerinckii]MBC2473127.1 hypothetical protein [Clostridium beijerinckii]NOV62369.1 hypothetical protein [Clostridium beijerinckii]NOV68134.1 hypothetical protein [Clostridium beijerinckii]NOW30421.1 hypothetical protein [Clostridium beijerinckii]